jgi:hypothetical protein
MILMQVTVMTEEELGLGGYTYQLLYNSDFTL